MKKIFRVKVWIDDKHFHTLQGEVSHVRNRRLALTQIFRNILRQLYTHGHLPATHEEFRTLRTLRTLVNRLESHFQAEGSEKER